MLLLLKWLDWLCSAYACCAEDEARINQMMMAWLTPEALTDLRSTD